MSDCASHSDGPERGRAFHGTSSSIWGPLKTSPNAGIIHSLALVLIVLVAATARFHHLDRTSLWTDELASWYQARLSFLDMLAATAQDNYPPLHNIILYVTMALFGDGETALRAPSALLGVANVFLLYWLASALWDRETGLVAALLLALSGFHVWYSTEARMYTLLAFTATLFVLTAVYATRRPNWRSLTACAGAGTALLYSHVYGSFVFAGVNIVVLIALAQRKRWLVVNWKAWAAAQAVPVLLFLPWALILWQRSAVVMREHKLPEPSAAYLLAQALTLTGGPLSLGILTGLAAISVTNLGPVLPASHSERLVQQRWANHWFRLDWRNAIVIAWIVVPICFGYLISIAREPILLDRYLICVLPAFLLLAARGLISLRVSTLGTAFLVGLTVMALIPDLTYNMLVRVKHDNRQAVRSFSTIYRPSDRIFFIIPTYGLLAFQYYFREPADMRVCTKPAELASADFDVERFWLIFGKYAHASVGLGKYALSMAERTHSSTYSLGLSPYLTMYLFQRRAGDLAVPRDASPSTEAQSHLEAEKASPDSTTVSVVPYDCTGYQKYYFYKPWQEVVAKVRRLR